MLVCLVLYEVGGFLTYFTLTNWTCTNGALDEIEILFKLQFTWFVGHVQMCGILINTN